MSAQNENSSIKRSCSMRSSFRALHKRTLMQQKECQSNFALAHNNHYDNTAFELNDNDEIYASSKPACAPTQPQLSISEIPLNVPYKARKILEIPKRPVHDKRSGIYRDHHHHQSQVHRPAKPYEIHRRNSQLLHKSLHRTVVQRRPRPLKPTNVENLNLTELIQQNLILQDAVEDKKHALKRLKTNLKSTVLPLEQSINKKISALKNMEFMAAPKLIHAIKPDEHAPNKHEDALLAERTKELQIGYLENALDDHKQKNPLGHSISHKMTKKQLKVAQAQLEKLTQMNSHLHALFSAVEHGHLDKARTILESTDVDVNSLNSDGLSSLDVAVLSNNRPMTKMLLQHAALGANHFKAASTLGHHLNKLLCEAENRIQDATDDISAEQINLWERRVKGLRRMFLGWDQVRPPDHPRLVTVNVCDVSVVSIHLLESNEGPIATKFKVQWSTKSDFSNIVGERIIEEWSLFQGVMGSVCNLTDLTRGRRYFFRACCGNVKGWGSFRISSPASLIPSGWRDVDNRESRIEGRQESLDNLFEVVRTSRPCDASELSLHGSGERRNQRKKTTIKQLFSATSKFQKNLKRGIYLACVLYHEDKVLVTNEDFLPVIEIDDIYPSSLNADFHWFLKVACTWEDVKPLRTDMEKNCASNMNFRTKLLTAASHMQHALCVTDLGHFFHKPLKDSHGVVVMSCVNAVKNPKMVSILNTRWVPLNKLLKKLSTVGEENSINEVLVGSVMEQINYHQNSTAMLSAGLYLGYFKMQSSFDQIQIVVPRKTPNVIPHCKIRENSHMSGEEWQALRRNKRMQLNPLQFAQKTNGYSDAQKLLLEALSSASQKLFATMNITADEALKHRLYDMEVVEISKDVSFLIICPPVEQACAVPGQNEAILQNEDLLTLPIQVFELVHLQTYQPSLIQKFSRLSCILEWDTTLANQTHREAFSSNEVKLAKERLAEVNTFTETLNAIWKNVRWLMDVVVFARDKTSTPSLSIREIVGFNAASKSGQTTKAGSEVAKHITKESKKNNTPGRGSWPPGDSVKSRLEAADLDATYENLAYKPNTIHLRPNPVAAQHRKRVTTNLEYITTTCQNEVQENKENGIFKKPSLPEARNISRSLHASEPSSPTPKYEKYHPTMTKYNSDEDVAKGARRPIEVPLNFSCTIQVYAAYKTGLASGTSLKLHVSHQTTAREVIDLVVKQLNMASVLKGENGPVYNADKLENFCLVAVIGARERCLRDDFKPLQLQNPWRKGRLYVRQKHELLAAIEHSNLDAQFI